MKADPAFTGHCLPKKVFGRRTQRECTTSGKRDNVVLIELSDDFGDVHVLDVPEFFQEKFRKNSEIEDFRKNSEIVNVIKIDDDDDDDDEVENSGGVCDMDSDATTSSRSSSTSAGPSSNHTNIDATINIGFPATSAACFSSAYVDEDSVNVNEGNAPVKLSKSKRTYSGKSIPRNCYRFSCDSESCSSESDCSDCEVMEGSFEKLREQWDKAFVKRRRNKGCNSSDTVNIASTSTAFQPAHNSDEIAVKHPEAVSQQSNSYAVNHEEIAQKLAQESKFSHQDCDAKENDGLFTRRHDDCCNSSNVEGSASETNQSAHHNTELPGAKFCFTSSVNYVINSDSHEQMAEQTMFAQQNYDAKETGKESTVNYSTYFTKGVPYQQFEINPAFTGGERGLGKRTMGKCTMLSNNTTSDNNCEGKPPCLQNDIIMDRQKIKETDEYKRAMEEELASRQQQLQRQAEEAQRLRSKKRAEKMRILDNERRQKQRLEEVRETLRKDEENLNLKEKLRVEIRKQLHKLETTCGDMASLLRSLGIHVGGGFFPSPNEVQAAYKRACLKFHPDRLSSTDLYQQVEAEEKFKLISNMKERFLSR